MHAAVRQNGCLESGLSVKISHCKNKSINHSENFFFSCININELSGTAFNNSHDNITIENLLSINYELLTTSLFCFM